ncbi:MAG: hypothetical protein Q7U97_07745 [Rhodocyclaceae bacterium]|nr:hypothetical protein [Rhodocyclaceae bacterium]
MTDIVPLTLYMLVSPLILIPCLFVGTAQLRFPHVLLLGLLYSSIGALFTFPLIHFFAVSAPVPTNDNVFFHVIVAGAIAGTSITTAMFLFSRREGSNGSEK